LNYKGGVGTPKRGGIEVQWAYRKTVPGRVCFGGGDIDGEYIDGERGVSSDSQP